MNVVNWIKENTEDEVVYNEEITNVSSPGDKSGGDLSNDDELDRDELFIQAAQFMIESEKGSIGSLQRKFRIGFNRAARIVDQLSDNGILGPEEGTKPRQVLMSMEQFENWLEENG